MIEVRLEFQPDNEQQEYDAEFGKVEDLFAIDDEPSDWSDRDSGGQIAKHGSQPDCWILKSYGFSTGEIASSKDVLTHCTSSAANPISLAMAYTTRTAHKLARTVFPVVPADRYSVIEQAFHSNQVLVADRQRR